MEHKEENEQKVKKLILTITMVVLLILAVTLTTYAFFTYYRSGAKNNQLITGRIRLVFEDGENNINLTNQFPIADDEAILLKNSSNDVAITNFTISGYAGSSVALYYQIHALMGQEMTGYNRMPDNHIKLYLTYETNATDTTDAGLVEVQNGYDTADEATGTYGALASVGREKDTSEGGQILLALGQVGVDDSVHSYTLRMWISDDVTISDTDSTKTYCASEEECNDSRLIFSTMYYSIKLKVENYNID